MTSRPTASTITDDQLDALYARLRPSRRCRKGRPKLTAEQQALADDLHVRALAIRAASEGELSVADAVHLAAVQLGLETPQTDTEEAGES
ncbi:MULTISPECIES: hypothetical protein [Streptomyces]|uniref:hypothetical protein n=1 Tax=Streptomyces TaxID=1883 RepID=UPI0004CCE06A|nr:MULTISPECIES: hypothetical protein [Streptomyces]KOT49941.1 hypothetical protein ADK43_35075 [Streptomyces rimosus subsp. rimosus]